MYQESKKGYLIETLYVLQTEPKRLYKAYIRYRILYVLEADNKSVKSIYTSQLEQIDSKERKISAYALMCVRDRSDRDCREHICIELGTRPK